MPNPVRALFLRLSHTFGRLAGEDIAVRRIVSLKGGREPPKVQLRLDRLRTLRLTMKEAKEIQRRTGVSLLRGIDLMAIEEEQFMEFLAVCASHEDPEVTADQFREHMYGERFIHAFAAVLVLCNDFFPQAPEDAAVNPLLRGALAHLEGKG